MSDQFVGEIRRFGFNFAPSGWAFCSGQLLPISQNTALFSLLGVNYGGNGVSTFGLPNLQGNIIVGYGQGPGLSSYQIGQTGGSASVTLTTAQLPAHTHAMPANTGIGTLSNPVAGAALGSFAGRGGSHAYASTENDSMSSSAVATGGGGVAHNNLAPYVVLNYCIALTGIFPSRN